MWVFFVFGIDTLIHFNIYTLIHKYIYILIDTLIHLELIHCLLYTYWNNMCVTWLIGLIKQIEPFSSLNCGRELVVDIVDTLVIIYLLKQHVRYLVDLVDKPYRALFKSYVWSCIGGWYSWYIAYYIPIETTCALLGWSGW